jgi:hypothetical protein
MVGDSIMQRRRVLHWGVGWCIVGVRRRRRTRRGSVGLLMDVYPMNSVGGRSRFSVMRLAFHHGHICFSGGRVGLGFGVLRVAGILFFVIP